MHPCPRSSSHTSPALTLLVKPRAWHVQEERSAWLHTAASGLWPAPVKGTISFQGVCACTDRVMSDVRCTRSPLCPGWLCRVVVLLPCREPVPGHHCATAEQGRIAQER
jgi:hypothetical protein